MTIINKNATLLLAYFFMALGSLLSSAASAAKCEYIVTNDWGSGFTASIRITNDQSTTLNSWQVSWNYSDGSRRTGGWNANVSGNNPYTALPLSWNSTIAPNGSVEFGVQGTNGGTKATIPTVTGSLCNSTSSSTPASLSSASISRSSVVSSAITSSVMSISSQSRSSLSSRSSLASHSAISSTIVLSSSLAPSSSSRSSAVSSSSIRSSSSSSVSSDVATCNGYATRYWDCCKPHCGWSGNIPAELTAIKSCAVNNLQLDDLNLRSSCDGGPANMCWGMTPFAVNEQLSYGYAATSSGDVCGRCYLLQFTGSSYNSPGDPGSAALAGKSMIVQATNIGYDVGGGQFDILVPGGGVGAFNACSSQWGVSNAELGAQYGGLVAACKQELGYNATLTQYKTCLTNRCTSVFGSRGLTDLQKGCQWYADWFEAADNPALKYKEVACPAELIARSGMNRSLLNDIKNTCR